MAIRPRNLNRWSQPPAPDAQEVNGDADHYAIDPPEKYTKRQRHKTKADKYEYKGEVRTKRPAKRLKASKRKRLSGRDTLGEEFRAANIDVKRITLKPEDNLGIFSRSKKSIPLAGRDLPDLTFTKMSFLSKATEAAEREIAIPSVQQNDITHERNPADQHCSAQFESQKSSSRSEYPFHARLAAEHGQINVGQGFQIPELVQNLPRRATTLENIL